MNLLCKWWWKLEKEKGHKARHYIQFKYLQGESICTMKHRQNDLPVWLDLLKIRNIYMQGRSSSIKNKKKTLF